MTAWAVSACLQSQESSAQPVSQLYCIPINQGQQKQGTESVTRLREGCSSAQTVQQSSGRNVPVAEQVISKLIWLVPRLFLKVPFSARISVSFCHETWFLCSASKLALAHQHDQSYVQLSSVPVPSYLPDFTLLISQIPHSHLRKSRPVFIRKSNVKHSSGTEACLVT